jgi:hypothetical protein
MFRKTHKSLPPNPIHLRTAVLCVDCESVAEPAGSACPVCGSQALIQLSRALGGIMGAERIARLDVFDDPEMRVVRQLVDSAEEGQPPVPA